MMTSVHRGSNLGEIIDGMIAHMKTQIENPALLNSRFVFDEVLLLDVNFHRLNLTRGSSFIKLPNWLAKKGAIVNPKNKDPESFKWAVIAVDNRCRNPQRISKLKEFEGNYDWTGLTFPVSTENIEEFEVRNNISINLLSIDGEEIYIHRGSKLREKVLNLMLIHEGERRHYTAVMNLSRLLSFKNSKHKGKMHYCNNCLNGFNIESKRDEHYRYRIDNEMVRVEMPSKGLTIEFYDGQNQLKVPFMMYVDFELILTQIEGPSPDPINPYTKRVNQHISSGFCVYSKFAYGEVKNSLYIYRGKDRGEKFCKHIKEEAHRLYDMFPEKLMDKLTEKQWRGFRKASKCHICYRNFQDLDPKVRDHCHYTSKYRGPAHRSCNLGYKIPTYISVMFHNLTGYDVHLFIMELGKKTEDINVIAKNKEDYISILIKVVVNEYIDDEGNKKDKMVELRFIHSFKFMSSSLDSLTNTLVDGGRRIIGFESYSEDQYELPIRKGIYPYEYMSSWDKFEETQLPPKKSFYSNLNMVPISDKDYQHAKKVWSSFGIRNLRDYHNLYLKTDVIFLFNIFKAFRDTCLEHYDLDPAHFFTSPGLAWKACLKKTGIKLKLLTNPNMLMMFEHGI